MNTARNFYEDLRGALSYGVRLDGRFLFLSEKEDFEPLSLASPTSLLFFTIAQNKEGSLGTLVTKHKEHHLAVMLFMLGKGVRIRSFFDFLVMRSNPYIFLIIV